MKDKRMSGAFALLSDELDNDQTPKYEPAETKRPKPRTPEVKSADTNKPVSKKSSPRKPGPAKADSELVSINPDRVCTWRYKDRKPEDLTGPEYDELLQSIARKGQDTPILVRPIKDKSYDYEEVTGFRRLHICRALGIPVIALVRDMNDRQAFSAQIDENDKRTGTGYWRRAQSLKMVVDDKVYPSLDAMSVETGIARSTISNYIRIVDGMPEIFKEQIPLQNCPREVLFFLVGLKFKDADKLSEWINNHKYEFIVDNPIRLKLIEKSYKQFLKQTPHDEEKETPVKKDGAKTYMGKAGKLFSITRKGDQVNINILKDGKRIIDDEELAEKLLKIMDEKVKS